MSANKTTPKNYEQAMNELDTIARKFENEEISIDELSTLVERAAFLLTYCREKLRNAETDMQRILSKLDDEETA